MDGKRTFHIIGGGIAGLYAAKRLREKFPTAYIVLYEAAQKAGGRCGGNYSRQLQCQTDNATHVILSFNRLAYRQIGKKFFRHKVCFFDYVLQRFKPLFRCLPEAETAVFNTLNADWRIRFKLYNKLFYLPMMRAYFSQGDLYEKLCAPMLASVNEIKFGAKWQNIKQHNGHITQLIFNRQTVDVAPQDIIISAIDSANYQKIFTGKDFEYNAIADIFYRTSMSLSLPQNQQMLGISQAQSQWLFSGENYMAVTVSNAGAKPDAGKIWQEICDIRNYNSAFMPTYEVRWYPRATIKQDSCNNNRRPRSCRTEFDNLLLCGDWTMKNHPCCIETAMQSAVRVLKNIIAS